MSDIQPPIPTPETPSDVPVAEPPRRRRWGCCLIVVIVLVATCAGLVVVGGAGYLLYQSGQLNITQRDLLALAGQAPGEIGVVNLSDDRLSADLVRLDTEDGEPTGAGDLRLQSFEIGSMAGLSAGRYELTLSASGGGPGGTCFMTINNGDIYQFVAVPEGIAVTLEGATASTAGDVLMESSPLCAG